MSSAPGNTVLRELVVCSLEPWDDVWRRNQFFVDALLKRNVDLRVLFVEPAADALFDLRSNRTPTMPRLRRVSKDGRLRAVRPLKLLPRKAGGLADTLLLEQVILTAKALRYTRPTLWINDATYAPLIAKTRWPSLYDVTDDWLLAPAEPRERDRLRRLDALALARADEVVVCSPALAESRGKQRAVTLVPNGVDVEHFRRPRPRPTDLPASPTAVYLGTLHDARIDVELVVELATAVPELKLVFVGPDALGATSRQALQALPNLFLLGPRAYEVAPAYLQHADVVVVPHRVSDFSETLDPIKAYECLAIDRPTVATPVAGFREHDGSLIIATRDVFADRVESVLRQPRAAVHRGEPVSWEERAAAFEGVLRRVADNG